MSAARRILLVVPFELTERRGNSVSAARIDALLCAAGHRTEIVVALGAHDAALRRRAREFAPHLVHAIHAYRAGPLAVRLSADLGVPLVVSFRGTDVVPGLDDPALRPLVDNAVSGAAVLTALTEDDASRVRAAYPARGSRIVVVPNSVEVPSLGRDEARRALGLAADVPVVAHLAGIRRVKGFPAAWALADALRTAIPGLRYVHAGGVLEPDLAPAADAWFASRPWAMRLGAVPRDRALAALAAADVSLHASISEGLSNALLESMALGIVPVARDLPASRAAVTDGEDGLLFREDAGAVRAVQAVLRDARLAARLSAAARRTAASRFSPAAEAAGYLRAHGEALSATPD